MGKERCFYISIGIDVGADFSLMAAALPSQESVGNPYKILHSSRRSVQGAIDRIFSLSQQYGLPARVYMESTSIYHLPLYHKLKDAGLDAKRIALLGLRPDLKTSIIPDDDVAALKALLREYHTMKKEIFSYICRLKNQLRQSFLQYLPIFSKLNGKASMAVLSRCPSPESVLDAGIDELAEIVEQASGKGAARAREKAATLLAAAQDAMFFGHGNKGICYLIQHYVEMLRLLEKQTAAVLNQINQYLVERPDSHLSRKVKLLQTIPGAGFLTAVTLVCEIGDFSAFRRPKQLYSYFGLEPAVSQFGNSAGADMEISKRGSPYARRSLYVLALQSVSLRINGEPKNPVIHSFYQEKCKSKAKMTSLGAVMHKLCNIVFAVLRDEKPFALISPQEHRQRYQSASMKAA